MGNFVDAATKKISFIKDVLNLEALVVLHDLEFAHFLEIEVVHVEGDAALVFYFISNRFQIDQITFLIYFLFVWTLLLLLVVLVGPFFLGALVLVMRLPICLLLLLKTPLMLF